jgi:pyridoxal phosphate enzyme (YggS family)
VVELVHGLRASVISDNLARVRERIAAVGRDPSGVEVLAAVKYVPLQELEALAQAGITLVGENRAQDLTAKTDAMADAFTWDFIGHLQSRKVRDILPRVRYVHSVASDSVLAQLQRHGTERTQVLIEVNVAGEAGKSGLAPAALEGFIARCPVAVIGLMTMPPLARRAEDNRRHFAALGELAGRHKLSQLSMGTSQDYDVAVQEGATIVRLGTMLWTAAP